MLESIIESYSAFFSMAEFNEAFFHSSSLGIIATLIILEGLLSADNAIVLAIMVKHLPPAQRKKALMYGLLGAYVFRFIAIGLAVYLADFKPVQVVGGGYLVYLALSHFFKKPHDEHAKDKKPVRGFWQTVVLVELMDIAFGIDSILAAVALATPKAGEAANVWILLTGGMVGILMMRTVAQFFLKIIDRIPELEAAAFVLILVIGLKLLAGVLLNFHIGHGPFLGIVAAIFAVAFIIHYLKKKKLTEKLNQKQE
ncbi:MAG: hypothetical protein K0R18_1778 [Bacillales bacterium]|nr:hypothetical protein [Bacillales bacterium]